MTKRHVESLLSAYDDDPRGALTDALAVVLDADPALGFDHLVRSAGLDPALCAALLEGEVSALDDLAQQLNEQRSLG